jgi:hypothetical protein
MHEKPSSFASTLPVSSTSSFYSLVEVRRRWRYCVSRFRLTIVKTNSPANQHQPAPELNKKREAALSFVSAIATAQLLFVRRTRCAVLDCSGMVNRLKRHAVRSRGAGPNLSVLTIGFKSR